MSIDKSSSKTKLGERYRSPPTCAALCIGPLKKEVSQRWKLIYFFLKNINWFCEQNVFVFCFFWLFFSFHWFCDQFVGYILSSENQEVSFQQAETHNPESEMNELERGVTPQKFWASDSLWLPRTGIWSILDWVYRFLSLGWPVKICCEQTITLWFRILTSQM